MKKYVLLIVTSLLMSGCSLTDFAADYFLRAQQVNNFEEALDVDEVLCNEDVLAHLRKTRGKDWYDASLTYCKKKNEDTVPLVK